MSFIASNIKLSRRCHPSSFENQHRFGAHYVGEMLSLLETLHERTCPPVYYVYAACSAYVLVSHYAQAEK